MAHLSMQKDPSADPALAQTYAEMKSHGFDFPDGQLPNITAVMALVPGFVRGLWGLQKEVFASSGVPPTVKQLIGMTIAYQTDCRYCAIGIRAALQSMGVPSEVIESCASDPELSALPPPQRRIVKFALKVAKEPKHLTAADYDALRDDGLADEEIVEIIMVACLGVMTDIFADATGVELDDYIPAD